ncbi:hypothetical protein BGZ63DRAFT_380061 [Mariannaea sp. PMI_226]|nr:hypothetical protein BGZ63DRAFT_380061 [Mariannaea sp. PMI_226]
MAHDNNAGKRTESGKGKEKDTSTGNLQSITDRIQASGRLALKAATGGPDFSTSQTGEKGTPSFSTIDKSSSVAGEASSQRGHSSVLESSIRLQPTLESSAASREFSNFAEAEPLPLGIEPHLPHHLTPFHQIHHPSPSIAEQEREDGGAVLDLLDGPSDELDAVLMGTQVDITNDNDDLDPLTVAKLRDALFDSSHLESRWDDMLNFTPDFLRPSSSAEDTLLHMGTSDPEEARSIWLHQWSDVLSSYTDQVWGDLGDLVTDARKEVEDLTSNRIAREGHPETKALDRLRQILAHVRGH